MLQASSLASAFGSMALFPIFASHRVHVLYLNTIQKAVMLAFLVLAEVARPNPRYIFKFHCFQIRGAARPLS